MLRGKGATATPMGSWVARATHVVGPSEQEVEMPAWVVSDFCSPPPPSQVKVSEARWGENPGEMTLEGTDT